MTWREFFPRIARLLYNHNPFYVLSAACMVYALKLLFRPGEVAYLDPWALMGAIAGYTVLMAVTGYLVVKLGHVWEDARTIFLVLLLLFFATSVTFDELLNLHPDEGRLLIGSGFLLAVVVTEGILQGLRIRLRALFRIPYYLWLALLYFFPLWVSPELTELGVLETSWRLVLFPVLAGGIALCLLPAVWRSTRYCANNGTPWGWPLYPWTLFLFLALATLLRTYALTISFLPSDRMETAFQPYFLIPFLLPVLIVLAVMGRVERRQGLVDFGLNGTLLAIALSWPLHRHSGPAGEFLQSLVAHVGSPVWLTLFTVLGVQVVAWVLQPARSLGRVYLCLVALVWVGPATVSRETIQAPASWPLLCIACAEFVRAVKSRNSLLAIGPCALAALGGTAWMSDLFGGAGQLWLFANLFIAGLLISSALFQDETTLLTRPLSLLCLTALLVGQVTHVNRENWGQWMVYGAGIVVLCALLWWWSRDVLFLSMVVVLPAAGLVIVIVGLMDWSRRRVGGPLFLTLLFSLASFLTAAAISYAKARGKRVAIPPAPDPSPGNLLGLDGQGSP